MENFQSRYLGRFIKMDHVKCSCGGIIGDYGKDIFKCEKCGLQYKLYDIQFDELQVNNKTGWVFPMKHRAVV